MAVALVSTPLAARQPAPPLPVLAGMGDFTTYVVHRESIARPSGVPLELVIASKPDGAAHAAAVSTMASTALAKLDDWLGPTALDRVVIIDAPWRMNPGAPLPPGVVVVHSRWHTLSRDKALERAVIAGLTRLYWPSVGGDWFGDSLARFTAGRAIDTLLEGSQFYSDRYLGGFVAHTIRSVSLSPIARDARPRLRRYAELDSPGVTPAATIAQAARGAEALTVVERYLGWPAVQQALRAFRSRHPGGGTIQDFAAVASEQAGRDLAWLFMDLFNPSVAFDYAVSALESNASTSTPGRYDVRVVLGRPGAGVFAGASGDTQVGTARSLEVETRFADGTVARDWWDGRQASGTLEYVSASPAVSATIDPGLVLILDEQRGNNRIAVDPSWNRLAARLALGWAIWLQNAMLAYSGIV